MTSPIDDVIHALEFILTGVMLMAKKTTMLLDYRTVFILIFITDLHYLSLLRLTVCWCVCSSICVCVLHGCNEIIMYEGGGVLDSCYLSAEQRCWLS